MKNGAVNVVIVHIEGSGGGPFMYTTEYTEWQRPLSGGHFYSTFICTLYSPPPAAPEFLNV
jgi:hypothetical protein